MPRLRSSAAWALVALAASLATPAAAQPAVLFDAEPPPAHARLAPEAGHAARARYVRLDLDSLEDAARLARSAFALDLFDGERITVSVDRVEERGAERRTWFGRVEGRPAEPVSLAVEGAAASGRIVAGGRTYLLAYAGAGRHVLYEYAEREGEEACHTLPAEEPDDLGGGETPGTGRVPAPQPAGDEEPLDLMVVYTGAVAAALGEEGLAPYLQSLLDVLNESFAAAGTPHTARLVAAREVAYAEDPTRPINVDLARLSLRSDGHLDEVHAWRDAAHADAVVLLVEEGAAYCGVAYHMSSLSLLFASSAFAVVKRGCALGGLNFAHEVGHLLGIRHDVYVDNRNTPAPYAHGFVNTAPTQNPPFRTVLAYSNLCIALGIHCPVVPAFSTTAVTLGGDALGDATADAARVFERSVPLVASFRDVDAPRPPPLRVSTDEDTEVLISLLHFLREHQGVWASLLRLGPPTAGSVAWRQGWERNIAVYRPPPDFFGSASFTYAFLNGAGQEMEGVVEITVRPVNDAPTRPQLIAPPPDAALVVSPLSDETLEVVWEPAYDVDGDELSYTWQLAEGFGMQDHPLLVVEAGPNAERVEVPLARLAEVLEGLGVTGGAEHRLYHRVSASDGTRTQYDSPKGLRLTYRPPRLALRSPHPNPTQGPLGFILDLPEDAALHLTLYDVLGRTIRVLEADVAAGHYREVAFDVGGLAAGLYLYRLRVAYGATEAEVTGRLAILD